MAAAPFAIRLDPWAAEYEGAIQLPDDEPSADVDTSVETPRWEAVTPAAAPTTARIAFVDGVRRIEHRLLVEEGDRTFFGLAGSFGVGAVEAWADRGSQVVEAAVVRVLVVGGGRAVPPITVELSDGRAALRFEPEVVPENAPAAALLGLQIAMRRKEAEQAESLAGRADLVFLDGPLTFLTAARGPIVGFVKRLVRSYLPPAEAGLLRRLEVGERTPLFLIRDPKHLRYSWYARLGRGRAIDSSLAGVVRLETGSGSDLAATRALADRSARELPRFANQAFRDPRAPQNLVPIAALERSLRHLLGDPLVVRRAFAARLHREVA